MVCQNKIAKKNIKKTTFTLYDPLNERLWFYKFDKY